MIKLTRENIITIFLLFFACSVSLPQVDNIIEIGIVHSELTKQLLYKNNDRFYPILDWELFFLNKKLSYSVIKDKDLSSLGQYKFDILILPSVEILSDQAIENLKEFLSAGKSIFVLGKLGSFDPQLMTRKPDGLEILAGLNIEDLPVTEKISEKHLFFNSNFLTQNLNGDFEALILNIFNPLYARKTQLNTKPLGNYLLNNLEEADISGFTGAAAIEKEKGKVLWFGFQLAQISLSKEDKNFFDQIILNGINWLAGNPLIWINRFPEFYGSATLFSVWINNIDPISNKEIQLFKQINVPLNFFISPLELEKSFEEIYKLSSSGSLNLLFDDFNYLDSDTTQIQMVFKEASKILKGGSRQEYFGVQILNMDEINIYKSLINNYFDFLISSGSNFQYLKSEEELNSLQGINFNYVNNPADLIEGSPERDLQKVDDLYKNINRTGGIVSHIVMENLNSNLYITLEEKLRHIINSSKLNNSYITTYPDLIDWFKAKNNIEVNVSDFRDEEIITLEVRNIGNVIAEQIGLNIYIPNYYKNPTLAGYNFKFSFNSETGYYNLIIPFLHSLQTLRIDIEYRK